MQLESLDKDKIIHNVLLRTQIGRSRMYEVWTCHPQDLD